jgi:hypothetical protein
VVGEEDAGQGGVGQQRQRLGAADLVGVGVGGADQGREVVDHRVQPGHVPGAGLGDEGLQPGRVGSPALGDVAFRGLRGPAGLVPGGVRGDHLGLHDLHRPPVGQPLQRGQCLGVDQSGLLGAQHPGGLGDLAGLPVLDLPAQHRGPQPGEPVPQLQRITDQALRGGGAGLQQHPELDTGELGDHRGALDAEPEALGPAPPRPVGHHGAPTPTGPVHHRHRPLHRPLHRPRSGCTGGHPPPAVGDRVQVGPVRGQRQPERSDASLRADRVHQRVGARGGVQLIDDHRIEHVFDSSEHRPGAPSPDQPCGNRSKTCPRPIHHSPDRQTRTRPRAVLQHPTDDTHRHLCGLGWSSYDSNATRSPQT